MLRAVVDTNIWVSAVLNPNGVPARLLNDFTAGRFTLLTSIPLLDELAEVLARPRIARKYRLEQADIDDLITAIRHLAIVVPIVGSIHLCRDPDDDVVIETAVRGNADLLVSRDDDLKGASEVIAALASLDIEVVSVRQFVSRLGD